MNLVPRTDPGLRRMATPIAEYGDELTGPIGEMYALLDSMPGAVALAAPQVGWDAAAIVWRLPKDEGHALNPEIVGTSAKRRTVTEGCLTFPGDYWIIRRHIWVVVKWVDRFGWPHEERAYGLKAQMWQHEIDHLHGVLLPERLGARHAS